MMTGFPLEMATHPDRGEQSKMGFQTLSQNGLVRLRNSS